MHSEICAVPAERLVTERELLAPLPSLRPGIGRLVTRNVDHLAYVRFGSARYSVPVALIGAPVTAAGGPRPIPGHPHRSALMGAVTDELVAEHLLVAPGRGIVSTMLAPAVRGRRRGGQVRPKTQQEKAFCALGPTAEVFIIGAAAHGERAFLDLNSVSSTAIVSPAPRGAVGPRSDRPGPIPAHHPTSGRW